MLDMTQSKIAQHLFCHRKYILLQVMVKQYKAKKNFDIGCLSLSLKEKI